jgi:hypothetical protein
MAALARGSTFPITRVRARLRNGSSLPVLADTPRGQFVIKLRGAAQGPSALVAEVIVAELAEAIGLPVPERALIELVTPIESDDRNDELADLLQRSLGLNLGFRWLPESRAPTLGEVERMDDEFAVRVLWLDGLVMNLDRTPSNPNILLSKGQPWLIDHGAALGFQHDWGQVTECSPRETPVFGGHLFGTRVDRLRHFDPSLAARLSRSVLATAVEQVPDVFLDFRPPEWTVERARAAYVAFLWKRLVAPRPFV